MNQQTMKRLPSKTQRSKGFRAKHALQICLLLGVCFWLVYQVKHSRDKKKEFDDEKKVSVQKEDTLKLGRKDLPRDEPEKKIIPEEEERENPSEEDSIEEDPGNGDDELDDKRDPEENGEADEDQAIENNEGSLEDQAKESDDDHEAREEHYRGDDASSEVAHGEEVSALNGTKPGDDGKDSDEELPIVVTEPGNSDDSTEALDSSLPTNTTVGESVEEQSLLVETKYSDESSTKEYGGSEKEEETEQGSNFSEKEDTHDVMIEQEMNEDLDTLPDLKSHGDDTEEEVAAE